jgi:hypothetical protein
MLEDGRGSEADYDNIDALIRRAERVGRTNLLF